MILDTPHPTLISWCDLARRGAWEIEQHWFCDKVYAKTCKLSRSVISPAYTKPRSSGGWAHQQLPIAFGEW